MLSLRAPKETRCLIHQGTVANQLIPLLEVARKQGETRLEDVSLTISWPSEPGKLEDSKIVFATKALITHVTSADPNALAFFIEGVEIGSGEKRSLTIHAVDGQAWVPRQS